MRDEMRGLSQASSLALSTKGSDAGLDGLKVLRQVDETFVLFLELIAHGESDDLEVLEGVADAVEMKVGGALEPVELFLVLSISRSDFSGSGNHVALRQVAALDLVSTSLDEVSLLGDLQLGVGSLASLADLSVLGVGQLALLVLGLCEFVGERSPRRLDGPDAPVSLVELGINPVHVTLEGCNTSCNSEEKEPYQFQRKKKKSGKMFVMTQTSLFLEMGERRVANIDRLVHNLEGACDRVEAGLSNVTGLFVTVFFFFFYDEKKGKKRRKEKRTLLRGTCSRGLPQRCEGGVKEKSRQWGSRCGGQSRQEYRLGRGVFRR